MKITKEIEQTVHSNAETHFHCTYEIPLHPHLYRYQNSYIWRMNFAQHIRVNIRISSKLVLLLSLPPFNSDSDCVNLLECGMKLHDWQNLYLALQENVVFLTEKFAAHDTDLWGKLYGFIHYNIQYVVFIVTCITLEWQLDIS